MLNFLKNLLFLCIPNKAKIFKTFYSKYLKYMLIVHGRRTAGLVVLMNNFVIIKQENANRRVQQRDTE